MKRTCFLALVAVCWLCCTVPSVASAPADSGSGGAEERAIREVLDSISRLWVKGDVDGLARIASDSAFSACIAQRDNALDPQEPYVVDKKMFLGFLADLFAKMKCVNYRFSGTTISINRGIARVRAVTNAEFEGGCEISSRTSMVFAKEKEAWRLVNLTVEHVTCARRSTSSPANESRK
jgi:hypothetical protein